MGIEPVAANARKTPPQWLLEGLLIIVSLALGLPSRSTGSIAATASLPRRNGNGDSVFSGRATFDPASRVASVRLLWLTTLDIESAEAILLERYGKHLPMIRAAANVER